MVNISGYNTSRFIYDAQGNTVGTASGASGASGMSGAGNVSGVSGLQAVSLENIIKQFTSGNLELSELYVALNKHGVKTVQTTNANGVTTVEFTFGKKKYKISCNNAAMSSQTDSKTTVTYTADRLQKTYGFDATTIAKYFDVVFEQNGQGQSFVLKANAGFKTPNELKTYLESKVSTESVQALPTYATKQEGIEAAKIFLKEASKSFVYGEKSYSLSYSFKVGDKTYTLSYHLDTAKSMFSRTTGSITENMYGSMGGGFTLSSGHLAENAEPWKEETAVKVANEYNEKGFFLTGKDGSYVSAHSVHSYLYHSMKNGTMQSPAEVRYGALEYASLNPPKYPQLPDGTILYKEYSLKAMYSVDENGVEIFNSQPLGTATGYYIDANGNRYRFEKGEYIEENPPKYEFPELIDMEQDKKDMETAANEKGYTKTACPGVYSQKLPNGQTVFYAWNSNDKQFERKNDIKSINADGTYVDRQNKKHSSYNNEQIQAQIQGYTPTVEEGLYYKDGKYYDYNETTQKFEEVDKEIYRVVDTEE